MDCETGRVSHSDVAETAAWARPFMVWGRDGMVVTYRQVMRRSDIDVIDGALREEYGRADVDARTRDI